MSWIIVRNLGADGNWSPAGQPPTEPPGYIVIRAPSGPSGPAAAMDLGVGFSNGYAASEVIPGPAALHPTPITRGTFRSLSGASAQQVFPILWYSAAGEVQIGQAVMDPLTQGGGPLYNGTVTITATGVTFAPGDVPALVCPNAEDIQLRDAELTLGGP